MHLIVLVSAAYAEPCGEADAERIARLFYRLTNRTPPDAFFKDDVDALMESGRSAQELETAIRWIVLNVPGADRYTLSGLLESHLATALGESEELILDPVEEQLVLAEVEPDEPGWTPSVVEVQELLEAFYVTTDRTPPDPPLAEDLDGIDALVADGWNEDGVRRLVEWAPRNVRGVELLSFGQVAEVAMQDNGYLGGPRRNGSLETLREVPGEPPADVWPERRVSAWDGGRWRTQVSGQALPGAIDWAGAPSRLPGGHFGSAEVLGGVDTSLQPRAGVLVGRARGNSGFTGSLGWGTPADSWGDPLLNPARSLSGRLAVGGRAPTSFGGTAWALAGDGHSEAGGSAEIRIAQDAPVECVLGFGAAGGRMAFEGHDVQRQRVHIEVWPTWTPDDAWVVTGRYRGTLIGGAAVDDAVFDDLLQGALHHGELSARHQGPMWAWGVHAGVHVGQQSLQWREISTTLTASIPQRVSTTTRRGWVTGAAELRATERVIVLGSATYLQDGATPMPTVRVGTRVSFFDQAWVGAWGQAGLNTPAYVGAEIGVPL